jgi:chorismate binding enzyme
MSPGPTAGRCATRRCAERSRWAGTLTSSAWNPEARVAGGAIGYFDFSGNADMCIAIRTVLFSPDGVAIVRAGAGVV